MSASTSLMGGARAQLQLRQVLIDHNVFPLNQPQVYIGRAREAFDQQLKLADGRHRKDLKASLRALVDWTLRPRPAS